MKARIRQIILILFVFSLLSGGAVLAEDVQGRVIICVQANAGLLNSYSFETEEVLFTTGDTGTDGALRSSADAKELRLITSDTLTSEALAAQAAALPGVLFAEPDEMVMADTQAEPAVTEDGGQLQVVSNQITTASNVSEQNAPLLSAAATTANYTGLQWGNKNTGQFAGTKGADIAYSAWNTTPDSGTVVAAVVDSGIDYNHPDLKNVMWQNDGRYHIGGGTYGYNALTVNSMGEAYDPADTMDDNRHGTHCAGIMAAEWNNIGTSGAVSGIELMSVKVLNDRGAGMVSQIIKGLSYVKAAILAGVNVKSVNYSIGTTTFTMTRSIVFEELGRLGCVVAKSSGNEAQDEEIGGSDTAAYSVIPTVVTVNALRSNNTMANFSNYGCTTTDVFAPGECILSTVPESKKDYRPILTRDSNTVYESFEADAPRYFNFHTDTTSSFYTDGSQALAAKTNASGSLVLVSDPIKVSEASKGLSFMMNIAAAQMKSINLVVSVKKKGEDSFVQACGVSKPQGVLSDVTAELPVDTDYDSFTLKIEVTGTSPNSLFYMDSLGLCTQKTDYDFLSGTSMAAPYVAAEAAYLSAKYSNEDAATIAARIKGGVIRSNNLENLSRSDGRISYEAAENPYPVINTASLDNETITLIGSFFGTSGTVTIGGAEARVINRTDTKIVCALPDSFTEGVNEIVIISARGYGRASLELGRAANLYEETLSTQGLPSYNYNLFALSNGAKPVIAAATINNTMAFCTYSAEENSWEETADVLDLQRFIPLSISFLNGDAYMLVMEKIEKELTIRVWHPQTKTTSILYPDISADSKLITVADRLIAVRPSNVYEVSPLTGKAVLLGSLPDTIFDFDVAQGPDSHSIIVYGGHYEDGSVNTNLIKVALTNTMATSSVVFEAFDYPENIVNTFDYYNILGTKDGLILTGLRDTNGNDTFIWRYATQSWAAFGKNFANPKAYNVKSWALNGYLCTYGDQALLSGDTGTQKMFRATAVNTLPLYVNTSTEAHIQNIGWQPAVASTHTTGTTGKALRMEAIKIKSSGISGVSLVYDAHIQNIGWQSTNDTADWKQEGQLAGTTGKALRMEAVKIALTGDKAAQYDIFYRAHVKNIGWQSWVKNGEIAGTTGQVLPMEALEVVILPKGENPENLGSSEQLG